MTFGPRNKITGGTFYGPVTQGGDITVQMPPQMVPALSGLPSGSAAFTGRESDLRRLLALLAPRRNEGDGSSGESPDSSPPPVLVTAVNGMPGVGKTELAVQAARTALAREWFPGGVLFADLFGYDPVRHLDPGGVLDGWLRALGIPGEHVPPEVQDRARLFASVLADYAGQDRRILLVIDNASSHEQVEPLLPADGTTMAIITSRDKLGMLDAAKLDVDVLAPQDAVTLLQRAVAMLRPDDTRINDHPDDAAQIATLCGGLPLALRIIAALFADAPAQPLAQMVTDLTEADSRLEEMCYTDTDTEIAVRAAFDLSYRHLTPEQARLFRLLALNPGNELGIDAAAELAGHTRSRARKTLRRIHATNLIEDSSESGRYRFHDLMREYARERLVDEECESDRAAATDRLVKYYQQTAISAMSWLDGLGQGPFRSRDQALAWLDTEYSNLFAAIVAAHGSGQWRQSYSLASELARYFEFRHLVDDGIIAHTRALDASSKLGREEQIDAFSNLGNAYRLARDCDASITHLKRALELAKLGKYRALEGRVLHNLGLTYFRMGSYADAESCHRDDLSICKITGDLRGEAQALVARGDALRGQKRYPEAARDLNQAIDLFHILGRPTDMMLARVNLALVYLDGRPHETASYIIWQLCLALKTAEEHDARPAKALIFLNLSAAYQRRCPVCHHDAAIHWANEAAVLFSALGDHYQEARALRSAGTIHSISGESKMARRYAQQAMTVFQRLGESEEFEVTRNMLEKEPPTVFSHLEHSQDEAARTMTAWCDDLPHAILRGEASRLNEVVFVAGEPERRKRPGGHL